MIGSKFSLLSMEAKTNNPIQLAYFESLTLVTRNVPFLRKAKQNGLASQVNLKMRRIVTSSLHCHRDKVEQSDYRKIKIHSYPRKFNSCQS